MFTNTADITEFWREVQGPLAESSKVYVTHEMSTTLHDSLLTTQNECVTSGAVNLPSVSLFQSANNLAFPRWQDCIIVCNFFIDNTTVKIITCHFEEIPARTQLEISERCSGSTTYSGHKLLPKFLTAAEQLQWHSPKRALLGDKLLELSQCDVPTLYGSPVRDGLTGDVVCNNSDIWWGSSGCTAGWPLLLTAKKGEGKLTLPTILSHVAHSNHFQLARLNPYSGLGKLAAPYSSDDDKSSGATCGRLLLFADTMRCVAGCTGCGMGRFCWVGGWTIAPVNDLAGKYSTTVQTCNSQTTRQVKNIMGSPPWLLRYILGLGHPLLTLLLQPTLCLLQLRSGVGWCEEGHGGVLADGLTGLYRCHRVWKATGEASIDRCPLHWARTTTELGLFLAAWRGTAMVVVNVRMWMSNETTHRARFFTLAAS